MSLISPEKSVENSIVAVHAEKINDMQAGLRVVFSDLANDNKSFNAEQVFVKLVKYLQKWDRVLYSLISNHIYASYMNSVEGQPDVIGTIQSNLDNLIKYTDDVANLDKVRKIFNNKCDKSVDDARKIVIKIWDHVTLASQQYTILKQSDAEYDEKFQTRIGKYKEEMTKEISAQMLTMVSIFTALAFLLFGGISSLSSILGNANFSLAKLTSIALIWGLCIINVIFIFLYCIGKLTHLSLSSESPDKSNVFKGYAVIWLTNLVMLSIFLISTWIWVIQSTKMGVLLANIIDSLPMQIFVAGTALVSLLIVLCIWTFAKMLKK